jgi:hypothetical protein
MSNRHANSIGIMQSLPGEIHSAPADIVHRISMELSQLPGGLVARHEVLYIREDRGPGQSGAELDDEWPIVGHDGVTGSAALGG